MCTFQPPYFILQLSGSLKSLCSLEGKVDSLEELKLAAAKDSMGDAATAVLSDLTSKTGSLEDEISALKVCLFSYRVLW